MSSIVQAQQHLAKGDYMVAKQIFNELIHNKPTAKETGEAYLGLGELALKDRRAKDAVSLISQACEYLSHDTKPLALLAKAYNMLNAREDALMVLNYANQIEHDSPALRIQLGEQQRLLGEPLQAKSHFLLALDSLVLNGDLTPEALKLGVDCLLALSGLAELLEEHLERVLAVGYRVEKQLQNRQAQTGDWSPYLVKLNYALAHLSNQAGDKQAIQRYRQANQLQHSISTYNTDELIAYIHSIKLFATPDAIALKAQRNHQFVPIFLVGLPLAGCERLEQYLLSHPQIDSIGSANILNLTTCPQIYRETAKYYPRCLNDLSVDQLERLSQRYMRLATAYVTGSDETELPQDAGREGRFIIDCFVGNFHSIALIYKLFPQAKVINVSRQPQALFDDVYRHYFADAEPYLCDQQEFNKFYYSYQDMMAHWQALLPGFILDVTVGSDNTDSRLVQQILTFCGLNTDL